MNRIKMDRAELFTGDTQVQEGKGGTEAADGNVVVIVIACMVCI